MQVASPRTFRSLGIVLFVAVYLCAQLYFVTNAYFEEDKRFGFWMFPEASYFRATLYRELSDGQLVPTRDGMWVVRKSSGGAKRYTWDAWVNDFNLNHLETRTRAKTSIALTLNYFQHALDFVAQRISEDAHTKRLVLMVNYTKAGGAPQDVALYSRERDLSAK